MHISEINIYPVKSLKGISLPEARVEERGLRFDRRWMLTDPDGMFFTQREIPKMATVSVEVNNSHLIVSAPEVEPLWISSGAKKDTVRTERVKIWDSVCEAAVYPKEVNGWFSDVLGQDCQLVLMPESTRRLVNADYAVRESDTVSFADGYPFLLIGEGSLEDLNSRLETPLPMNRFRPNFVVSGSEPFAEDSWKRIRIGEMMFQVVKPCIRCVITTTDQETGERGKEPLKTLAMYRNNGGGVMFGQNLIAEKGGATVKVGDEVEVIDLK